MNISQNTIKQLCSWCHGTMLSGYDDAGIESLVIDSRKIDKPETSLFIALVTSFRDGHAFISSAYEKGVRNFLISQKVDVDQFPDCNFILVKDTLAALQQIAACHRKQFAIPVIGITGSNGKTIVKEWLHQLLAVTFNTLRSPKSYNSQVGVPLSVWMLKPENELAIFEAGISQPGEMECLERIIKPTIGVFTNIGEAHSEGFLNIRQKINEKLFLFRNVRQLIYCSDYPELNECIGAYVSHLKGSADAPIQLISWSRKYDASLRILRMETMANRTSIQARYEGRDISITIPFTDGASIENAINCWCTLLALRIKEEDIVIRMASLQPVSMRLELKQGINDCTIINDTYNSDLTSLHLALDYLAQQKQHTRHTVILSDMLQVGKPAADLYEEVAGLIGRRSVQRFIGIGPALYKHKAAFRKNKKLRSIFFKSTEDFLKKIYLITFNDEAILLKGARVFAFEKISLLLEQKVHQTTLSISLPALTHNYNVFRSEVKPGTKIMAMVKAFAYGSGSYEIASLLQHAGTDYLTVAYTDEGIGLRKAGITMPIMVMSPDAFSFDRMIAWKLEPELFNFRSLDAFLEVATTLQTIDYPVHVKLDTGMHRLGFSLPDIAALCGTLKNNSVIKVSSIFSHLAASDDPEQDGFTKKQGLLFDEMSTAIIESLGYTPLRHLCNSAGIARHHELHYDMVRLGIGLYGIGSGELHARLRQISTLKTTIAQVKDVPAGDSIGYGHHTIAQNNMRIATICIGYADGYHRDLGNGNAYVLIHGKQARTVGSICMDMCMVDITNIPDAQEGDSVTLWGAELPLTELAKWGNTISYEMMTAISQRVKRVYVNED